jgi:hypothetical protein
MYHSNSRFAWMQFRADRRVRRLLVVALTAVTLVVSAGCGNDDDDKKPVVTTTPTPSVTTTPTPVSTVVPQPTWPEKMGAEATHSGKPSTFKTCHGMTTKASFYPYKSHVWASTHIWSHCEFGGFTGSAFVALVDEFGSTIGTAYAPESWGVQGKIEAGVFGGQFERSGLAWNAPVQWGGPADPGMVHHVDVVNIHAPRNRVVEIVSQGMAAGKKAKEIYDQISAEFPSS